MTLPCGLLEYFQAKAAVETAPRAAPVTPKVAASLAVFSWKEMFHNVNQTLTNDTDQILSIVYLLFFTLSPRFLQSNYLLTPLPGMMVYSYRSKSQKLYPDV